MRKYITVAVVVALVVTHGLYLTAASLSPAKEGGPPLLLRVQNNGETLIITNKSTELYHALTLRLVVGMDFNSYVITLRDIAPGKRLFLNLRDVTTDGGVRFNPVRYKPLIIIEGIHKDGSQGLWGAR